MCIDCIGGGTPKNRIPKALADSHIYLVNFNGTKSKITDLQKQEILDHASKILITGVDSNVWIFSIEWDYDYKPLNFG